MSSIIARAALTAGLLASLLVLAPPACPAQDEKPEEVKKKAANELAMQLLLQRADEEYRTFFRRPETVPEFWAAIKFEVGVGKFDLAALHLKGLVQKQPAEEVDKELLKIENVEGMSPFLRLHTIRTWSDIPAVQDQALKDVKTLLDRLTAALERHLGDPQRIGKFIKNLDAQTPEERLFAFVELKRSRERAVPYLVETLRTSVGTPMHDRVVQALLKLDAEIVPPLLEVLKAANPQDAQDLDLRLTILDVLKRRADKRAVPYLWHLTSAKIYPVQIQNKAKAVLAYFLETEPTRLPIPKVALTELAERHYQHKAKIPAGRPVQLWPWDGQKLATKPVLLTPSQAEEFFGLRYAREALDLDPKYLPAQIAFMSLMLERTLGPELDQVLLRPAGPKLQDLLATVDADLLIQVLERSLKDGNVPAAIATVQALGQRGETRAARLGADGNPRGIIRALYFPNRRVQLAAAKAVLRMPTTAPAAPGRVVDVLGRFLIAEPAPRALAAFFPADKTAEVRQAIKDIGLDPVFAKSGKDIFERLSKSADYDAILLGSALSTKELPYLLTNLRADADQGRLPIMIFAQKDQMELLASLTRQYRSVRIYPEQLLAAAPELKNAVEAQIRETGGVKLSPTERKEFAKVALDLLWRISRGENPGYDLHPAQDAIVEAARNPEMTLQALEILGRLSGQEPQVRLAAAALNLGLGKQRAAAASELNRHIQKNGLMLDKAQTAALKEAYKTADDDPALKAQLALTIGSMRLSPQATGTRLFDFRPDLPMAPVEQKEKEKEEK